MMLAVCIKCGNIKRAPISKCSVCNFIPQKDEDKAKSLILSTAYEIDGEYRGKTEEELRDVASKIANKQPFEFDDANVREVIKYAEKVLAIPTSRLIFDGLRWLLPPILVLSVIYFLLFLK